MINVLKRKLLPIKDIAKEIVEDSLSVSDGVLTDIFSLESLDLILVSSLLLTPENLIKGSNIERLLSGALIASPFIRFDKLTTQVILCGGLELCRRKRLSFKQNIKLSAASTLVAKGILMLNDKKHRDFYKNTFDFKMPDIQTREPNLKPRFNVN